MVGKSERQKPNAFFDDTRRLQRISAEKLFHRAAPKPPSFTEGFLPFYRSFDLKLVCKLIRLKASDFIAYPFSKKTALRPHLHLSFSRNLFSNWRLIPVLKRILAE
jgi:hypothetical protein